MAALRVRDLLKLMRARHGHTLPNDATGRANAEIIAHHLAALPGDQQRRISNWLELWAPWMPIAQARALTTEATTKPKRWRADALAWRLHIIEIDRATLGITTIGATDCSKLERKARRKQRNRLRMQEKRRNAGIKPRAQYLADVKARAKPWEAAGISRATWYRHRETGSVSTI